MVVLTPISSKAPRLLDLWGYERQGLAVTAGEDEKEGIPFSKKWTNDELVAFLHSHLPHLFKYLNSLPPRRDRDCHWYLCERRSQQLTVLEDRKPDGNVALLASGAQTALWNHRCLIIGNVCSIDLILQV